MYFIKDVHTFSLMYKEIIINFLGISTNQNFTQMKQIELITDKKLNTEIE